MQCYEATKAGWESLFRDQARFEKLEGVLERGVEEHGFGHWRGLDDGGVPEEHVEEEEEVNLSLLLPGDANFQVARPWKQQRGQQNTVIEKEESEDEESESEEETEEEEDDDGELVGKDGARGLGTEKLSYKEMNALIDESIRRKKPKKRDPDPDSDDESIPRDKPKKALPVRVSLGGVESDYQLPRKKRQRRQDPQESLS